MHTPIAIAVVEHAGRFLIGRREADRTLAGLWEFPGGRVEPGETPEMAAVRECREETDLAVEVVGRYEPVDFSYAHGDVALHFFACRPLDPAQNPHERFRWVSAAELCDFEFPPANAGLIKRLAEERRSTNSERPPLD